MKVEYSPHPGKNPCLLVDHYPLIPLPWNKTTQGLPIEVGKCEISNQLLVYIYMQNDNFNFIFLERLQALK